jgi:hypothetical protein
MNLESFWVFPGPKGHSVSPTDWVTCWCGPEVFRGDKGEIQVCHKVERAN